MKTIFGSINFMVKDIRGKTRHTKMRMRTLARIHFITLCNTYWYDVNRLLRSLVFILLLNVPFDKKSSSTNNLDYFNQPSKTDWKNIYYYQIRDTKILDNLLDA